MAVVSLRLVVPSNVTVEPRHDIVSVNVGSDLHLVIAWRLLALEQLQELVKSVVRVADELIMESFIGPLGSVFSDCDDLPVCSLMTFRAMTAFDIDTAQTCDRLHVLARPVAIAEILQCSIEMG